MTKLFRRRRRPCSATLKPCIVTILQCVRPQSSGEIEVAAMASGEDRVNVLDYPSTVSLNNPNMLIPELERWTW
jgi:hypothetical protein